MDYILLKTPVLYQGEPLNAIRVERMEISGPGEFLAVCNLGKVNTDEGGKAIGFFPVQPRLEKVSDPTLSGLYEKLLQATAKGIKANASRIREQRPEEPDLDGDVVIEPR